MRNFLFVFAFFLSSCEIPKSIQVLSEDQDKELSELSVELVEDAKALSACEDDSHCSIVGFNPKSCGGYHDFLVASQRSNKNGQLTSTAPSDDYLLFVNRLRNYRERVESNQINNDYMSTCDLIEAPPGRCIQKKCAAEQLQNIDP